MYGVFTKNFVDFFGFHMYKYTVRPHGSVGLTILKLPTVWIMGRPFVSRALWSRWCKDPQTSKRRWVQEEGPAADGDLNQILMVNFAPRLKFSVLHQ